MREIKTETRQHRDAFKVWRRLLNFRKTAEVMAVHEDTVANWAAVFGWREKYAKEISEKTDGEILAILSDFRRSGVYISDLIQGWIVRLATLCDDSIREGRDLTQEEKKTEELLTKALDKFNRIHTLIKNLFGYMKSNVELQVGKTGGGNEGDEKGLFSRGIGRVTFRGPTLILLGPQNKGGENGQILQLTGTGSKARTRLGGRPDNGWIERPDEKDQPEAGSLPDDSDGVIEIAGDGGRAESPWA